MKSKHLFLLLLTMSISVSTFSQRGVRLGVKKRNHKAKNAIKMDLVPLIFNAYTIAYEREIKQGQSLQVGLGGSFFIREIFTREFIELETYWITPEYRFYLTHRGQSLTGLYLAPYLKYSYTTRTLPCSRCAISEKMSGHLVAPGGVVGGQALLWDRVVINGSVGLGYSAIALFDKSGSAVTLPFTFEQRADPRANLAIGFAF